MANLYRGPRARIRANTGTGAPRRNQPIGSFTCPAYDARSWHTAHAIPGQWSAYIRLSTSSRRVSIEAQSVPRSGSHLKRISAVRTYFGAAMWAQGAAPLFDLNQCGN